MDDISTAIPRGKIPRSMYLKKKARKGSWAPMKKLRFLISLTTGDNDYQIEQAQSAEQAARNLGVEAQILYANNDAITQSTQILPADRPANFCAQRPLPRGRLVGPLNPT